MGWPEAFTIVGGLAALCGLLFGIVYVSIRYGDEEEDK